MTRDEKIEAIRKKFPDFAMRSHYDDAPLHPDGVIIVGTMTIDGVPMENPVKVPHPFVFGFDAREKARDQIVDSAWYRAYPHPDDPRYSQTPCP